MKFILKNRHKDELPSIVSISRAQEKVDLIVLLTHLSFPQVMKLQSEVDGVDICLNGNTHHRLNKPVLN